VLMVEEIRKYLIRNLPIDKTGKPHWFTRAALWWFSLSSLLIIYLPTMLWITQIYHIIRKLITVTFNSVFDRSYRHSFTLFGGVLSWIQKKVKHMRKRFNQFTGFDDQPMRTMRGSLLEWFVWFDNFILL
jgi:hypothetical protein